MSPPVRKSRSHHLQVPAQWARGLPHLGSGAILSPALALGNTSFLFLFVQGVFTAAHGLSPVEANTGHSVAVGRPLTAVASLVAERQIQGARAQKLWHTDLGALGHVERSRTRHRTHDPCTGRRILNHWITREVPGNMSFLVSRVGVEEERRLRVDSLEIYNSVDSKN